MAYYLTKERHDDAVGSYHRYQEYLRAQERTFPPGAFALGTAVWWHHPNDRRCPHDAWLETLTVSEVRGSDENEAKPESSAADRGAISRLALLEIWLSFLRD